MTPAVLVLVAFVFLVMGPIPLVTGVVLTWSNWSEYRARTGGREDWVETEAEVTWCSPRNAGQAPTTWPYTYRMQWTDTAGPGTSISVLEPGLHGRAAIFGSLRPQASGQDGRRPRALHADPADPQPDRSKLHLHRSKGVVEGASTSTATASSLTEPSRMTKCSRRSRPTSASCRCSLLAARCSMRGFAIRHVPF